MKGIRAFQLGVVDWMMRCFVRKDSMSPLQRSFRFTEEAIELAQAMGTTKEEVQQLVEYVYGRPPGAPSQEIGGVMVTLMGVAASMDLDVEMCADAELSRCERNIARIRQKDLDKPERAGAKPS